MTGSGTEGDPYIISNVTDLQAMENDLDAYYELGGNIDASATSGWNSGAGFVPITIFTGQLDGKGYSIDQLFINRPTTNRVGLFAKTRDITIQHIHLTNVDVTGQGSVGGLVGEVDTISGLTLLDCSVSGSVTGSRDYIGGLVGYLDVYSGTSTVTDCYSTATVSGDDRIGSLVGFHYGSTGSCIVSDCYATGAVTGDDRVGGLVGDLYRGTYTKCYSTGTVTGTSRVAGFTGLNDGVITDCYARGNVTGRGGFVGFNYGDIDNCYSTGIAGAGEGFCSVNYDDITNCFWDTETSGQATSDGGTGKTTAQMKTKSTFTDAGWDFTTPIWYILFATNSGYPSFTITETSSEGAGVTAVVEERLHYVGASGKEYWLQGVEIV